MARMWSIVLFEWSEVQVVYILGDKTISKCLYNLFLAVQQIRRVTLAGFSETNGVVYAKYHRSIIRITVLYEPNWAHNCTVWLIQYSYTVDYYFMIYSAHFFALILPRKVQYSNMHTCIHSFSCIWNLIHFPY